MIQLPKSTLEKINNMSLNELETVMEVQEDENIIGYAYYRMMWLKNNKKQYKITLYATVAQRCTTMLNQLYIKENHENC